MNEDTAFKVSNGAFARITSEAKARGVSVGHLFRGRAYRLAHADNPRFNVSGQHLGRTFHCGVNSDVYAALVSMVDQLDVPRDTIGELVCTHVEEYAYDAA